MGQYERESTRNRPGSVPSPISIVFGAMNIYLVAGRVWLEPSRTQPNPAVAVVRVMHRVPNTHHDDTVHWASFLHFYS